MSAFGVTIPEEAVCIYPADTTKHEAIDQLVHAIVSSGVVSDEEQFRTAVYERESVMSTGIGSGVAIPHVRIDEVVRPAVGVGISEQGIDFDTLDNEPVNVIVMFAMPSGSQKEYLGLLAQVMQALKVPGFRENLIACKSGQDVAQMLNSAPSQ
ncbi:MAG: PTS sugar transporter subunit IIA [Candidatus Hydrogenedentes bacterium]|nr:PTS sugar transporter subunit IIA [Candidatus Hydrogenedentota bacterium]